ncbi:MAG: hypothetical protein K1Y36_28170 [Blastocatellia bacterium]|nr:hypothetical protein [Blastocatellia bacterium]
MAVIFSGGGSGLLITAPRDADLLVLRIQEKFAKSTPTLGVTCAFEEITAQELVTGFSAPASIKLAVGKLHTKGPFRFRPDSTNSRGFGSVVQRIGLKLRLAKARKTLVDTIETSPLLLRCSSNSHRAAQIQDRQRNDRISLTSFEKREWGREDQKSDEKKNSKPFRQARDFQELVLGGSEKEYLGVIYLDGNRVGSLIESLETIDQFARFSALVEAGFKHAFENTLDWAANHFKHNGGKLPFPYLAPITGGDDVLLVVPAEYAMHIALRIGQTVEAFFSHDRAAEIRSSFNETMAASIQNIGVGIGLIIADVKFPIRYLVDYAEKLMKSAKSLTYQQEQVRSALDFMVISGGSPISTNLTELRKTRFHRLGEDEHETLKMTARPYSLPHFAGLLRDTEAMTALPAAQFRQIHRSLEGGRLVSESFIRYQFARLDSTKRKQLEKMGFSFKNIWDGPVTTDGQQLYTTSLNDILEILPFSTGGDDEASDNA